MPGAPAGEVRILVADSSTQEAALVADTLRRAHLADGVPWSSMAVLVRSATRQVPLLRRALTAANVPVTVAGDELPLADEPGTRPLLMLLRCALRPSELDEQTAAELLCGPLGGTDALGLRRLRRSLQLLADADPDPERNPREPEQPGERRHARGGPARPAGPGHGAGPGGGARQARRQAARGSPGRHQGRRQRRGRAVGHLGRLRPRRTVAAGQRGGRSGRGARTGTWTPCWPCSTRPRTSPTACRRARPACSPRA